MKSRSRINSLCLLKRPMLIWSGSDDNETVLSSTTTSMPSVSCSPRWIVYHNTRARGAQRVTAASTPRECLEACVADSSCVSVEWNDARAYGSHCWKHDRHRPRLSLGGITQFEIIRQCYQKPSTWRHHLFYKVYPFDLVLHSVASTTLCFKKVHPYYFHDNNLKWKPI